MTKYERARVLGTRALQVPTIAISWDNFVKLFILLFILFLFNSFLIYSFYETVMKHDQIQAGQGPGHKGFAGTYHRHLVGQFYETAYLFFCRPTFPALVPHGGDTETWQMWLFVLCQEPILRFFNLQLQRQRCSRLESFTK
jgi:hypothetical protein